MLKLKNAFTITETVIVVAVIGILMTAMTIYLDGSGERSKIIEAEGCAATLDGEIQNYMYYALTSKKLKVGENYDQEVSPNWYYIILSGGNIIFNPNGQNVTRCSKSNYNGDKGIYCDSVFLGYWTGERYVDYFTQLETYKELTSSKSCNGTKVKLIFHYGSQINGIRMKKGLSRGTSDSGVGPFTLGRSQQGSIRVFTGDIIILACMGPNCEKEARKEIGKREIDARSQTIALKKCKFYQDDNPMLCETRED